MAANIIVALDDMDMGHALGLAVKLRDIVWGFKLNDLLDQEGVIAIEKLANYGNVMADDKCHDIPNTITNKIRRFERAGAALITIHASGGEEMCEAAVREVDRAKILAVTALTSLSDDQIMRIYKRTRQELYEDFSQMAHGAGVHGIVCGHDFLPKAPKVRHGDDEAFLTVVPGIRPGGKAVRGDDQKVMATDLSKLTCTHVVVGRPITQALDPVKAATEIRTSLERG
jgi:orotidine-5'-phosphate decarboxylase